MCVRVRVRVRVCACACVRACVFVTNEDINLYDDIGYDIDITRRR